MRFRVFCRGRDLAAQPAARRLVRVTRLVADDGVHQLVVRQRVDALARAEGFERQHGRCHVDEDAIAGRAEDRGCIAAVAEVLQQDRDLAVRLVAEQLLLRVEAVQKTLGDVGSERRTRRIEVDDLEFVGLDDLEVLRERLRPTGEGRHGDRGS